MQNYVYLQKLSENIPDAFLSFDVRHEKTDLKVFVVVIPKEGCARMAFFWFDTDFSEFDSADITDYILEKSRPCAPILLLV